MALQQQAQPKVTQQPAVIEPAPAPAAEPATEAEAPTTTFTGTGAKPPVADLAPAPATAAPAASTSDQAFGTATAAAPAAAPVANHVLGGIQSANGQATIDLASPAEMVITAVDGGHVTVSGSAPISVAAILAQLPAEEKFTLAELQQVTNVQLAAAADSGATSSFKLSPGAIELDIQGLTTVQTFNAAVYKLTLASGRSVIVQAIATSFHVDQTEYLRSSIRQSITEAQGTIDAFTAAATADQAFVDHPPAPQDAGTRADLASTTSALDATNTSIAARVQQLAAAYGDEPPAQMAEYASSIGMPATDPTGPAGQISQTSKTLSDTSNQLVSAKQDLASKQDLQAALQDVYAGQSPAPVPLMQANSDVDAAQTRVQELQTTIDSTKASLMSQLAAHADLLERMLSDDEQWIGAPPDAVTSLAALRSDRALQGDQIAQLQQTLADEDAEPGREVSAAKSRVGSETQTVKDAQARIAASQAQLAALVGPNFVTLDANGALPASIAPVAPAAPAVK